MRTTIHNFADNTADLANHFELKLRPSYQVSNPQHDIIIAQPIYVHRKSGAYDCCPFKVGEFIKFMFGDKTIKGKIDVVAPNYTDNNTIYLNVIIKGLQAKKLLEA